MRKRLYRYESMILKLKDNVQDLTMDEFEELMACLAPFEPVPESDGEVKRYIQTPDMLRPEILKYTNNIRLEQGSVNNVFWIEKPIAWLSELSPNGTNTNAEYYELDPRNMCSFSLVEPITVMFNMKLGKLIKDDIANIYVYNFALSEIESRYYLRRSVVEGVLKTTLADWMTARGYTGFSSYTKAQMVEMVADAYKLVNRWIDGE